MGGVSYHSTFRDALRLRAQGVRTSLGLLGMVALLPPETCIDNKSCVRTQTAVNGGAFNHPCVILATSECGHLAFCAPCTSFGNQTIQQRFKDISENSRCNVFWRYVAFQNEDSTPHNGLGVLEVDGMQMPKRTYMHADDGFWIEWDNLAHISGHRRRLTAASLDRAQWAYSVAECHRQATGPHRSSAAWGLRSGKQVPGWAQEKDWMKGGGRVMEGSWRRAERTA